EGVSRIFDDEDVDQRPQLTENDFVMAMANNENDMFSYFDSAFLRNWAGPEHWKLKRVARDAQNETNSETKERKKKEAFSIDFIGSDDVNELTIFASGGNSLILPKLAEHVPHGHRLPDDMHFSSKQLLHLFLKPDYMLKVRRRYEQIVESKKFFGDDFEVGETFWAEGNNNENEENTSFPDMTMVTAGDTFFQDDDGFEDEIIDEGEFGDNLVSQARRTKPEHIKFARTAKRIDVKKLKDNIWKTLPQEKGTRRSLTRNTQISDCDQDENLSATQEQIKDQRFTDVIKNLAKIYPEKKMKDISVPFCFICLLHLANEKNLSITVANEGLTELEIKKTEKDKEN
ncbi:15990_t:CDS:2, partial [Acaulospora colombiana]